MIEDEMNTQDFAPQRLPHAPFAHEAMLPLALKPFTQCRRHLRMAMGKNCLQLVFQARSVQNSKFSSLKP